VQRHLLLALSAAAILAPLRLADCKPFEIHCDTADNCLQGQVCVMGLCQDVDGGTGGATGTGGAAGTGATSGTGAASGTGGTGGSGTDGGTCTPACTAPKPYCVNGGCVQCTQATTNTDCGSTEHCCSNNACSSLGLCL
jgi:hypothetical protein